MKNTAPEQKRIMRFLPPVFGVVLAVGGFPAGLFVYWVTSNLISIVQNLLIYRNVPKTTVEEDRPEEAAGPIDDGYRAKTDTETASSDLPASNGSGGQQSETGQRRRTRRR